MSEIERALKDWRDSLCASVDVGGLISRNEVAYKWKAPFRSLLVREAVCWRTYDLLSQAYFLYKADHILGSRVLLRSAFETLAVLIYLNRLMRRVVSGDENFHDFSDKTIRLLLGSKNASTKHEAIHILTVLQKCEDRFPGIEKLYAALSESAHPNFEGICMGYTDSDSENYITTFSNKWLSMYRESQYQGVSVCIAMFEHEYNSEWITAAEELELWIVQHDDVLESTKRASI